MPRAANEELVRRIFDAFGQRRDRGLNGEAFTPKRVFALRDLFAPDAVWTVPGNGTMAGTFRGREEIFAFLGRLPKETNGTYASSLIDVLASDDRAAALYRASGERNGRRLDIDQVLLFSIEDGRVREVVALPTDPDAFEEFWAA